MPDEWEYLRRNEPKFQAWDEPGTVIEGVWCGERPGKLGSLGIVEVDAAGQLLTFPMTIQLMDALRHAGVGNRIRITYTGTSVSQSTGYKYKNFNVQRMRPETTSPAREDA